MAGKSEVARIVTDRIIAKLDKGVIPWRKPWTGGAISHATGKAYKGVNQFILEPGEYATFKQIIEAGGTIKKGEKGNPVVFWKPLKYLKKLDNGKEEEKTSFILRYYSVFNIETQCEGLERKYAPAFTEIEDCENFDTAFAIIADYVETEGINFEETDGNKAFYSPTLDTINVPNRKFFSSNSAFLATSYHEVIHSTGNKTRIDRLEKGGFGSSPYAKEELIAELGAQMLCEYAVVNNDRIEENSVAYIQSWRKRLSEDVNLIIEAASGATKAMNYVLESIEEAEETEE